jgi:DNA-binding NarL/FixJ family response regulator
VLSILADDKSMHVVGEASDGNEAYEMAVKLNPDIALLDIDMPGLSGLDVARKLKQKNSAVKFVILTIHKEREFFEEAMTLDIKAYVLKDSIANDLISCIRKVAEGDYYISPAISGYLVEKRKDIREQDEFDKLTPAEIQILKLISQNKTSHQIAEELFRSVRTIENHRNNICSKLNLKGPHALLLFALENKVKFRDVST